MAKLANFKQRVRTFCRDERGIGVIEAVLMLAVAALVIVLLVKFGEDMMDWLYKKMEEIFGL